MDGPPNDLDPADLFRPHTGAKIDDSRTWVDPSGYRLSDRLWRGKAKDRAQIDQVLREGIARGSSPLQTAKALESLLVPSQGILRDKRGHAVPLEQQPKGTATRKPLQGPGQNPWRPRNSGTGSYSARRLARTETSRAFGAATMAAAKANPLVQRIKWRMSSSHGETDACDTAADNSSPGQPRGVYLIEDVPGYPNHPHEMCTLNPYVTDDDIKDAIPRLRRAMREDDFSADALAAPLTPTVGGSTLSTFVPAKSIDEARAMSDKLGAQRVIFDEEEARAYYRNMLRTNGSYVGQPGREAMLEAEIDRRMQIHGTWDTSAARRLDALNAVNENATNPAFKRYTDKYGQRPVMLSKARTQEQIDVMANADYIARQQGLSAKYDGEIRLWEYDQHPTVNAPGSSGGYISAKDIKGIQPGDLIGTDGGGLAATLRHEYGHGVWDDLDYEKKQEYAAWRPEEFVLTRDVTYYAGDNQNRHWPEDVPEIISMTTDPMYKPGKTTAGWVDRAAEYFLSGGETALGEKV